MKLVVLNSKQLDIGHEILYFNKESIDSIGLENVVDAIKVFEPDLIIEEEKNDGVSNYSELFEELPHIPKAWWCIDAHCNLIDHVVYAKQFSYVFCSQSWFLPIMKHEVNAQVFYLPLCHTQTNLEYELMLQTKVEKDIEFSFIGNIRSIHVERREYIKYFLEKFGNRFFAHVADYQTTLEYLRRSFATFNCSLNNDLNFRVWEALACGASVVTDFVTDIDMISGLRDYLTLYDKMNPNWDVLNYSFQSVDSSQFMRQHTLTNRFNQLLYMATQEQQYGY